MARLVEDLLLLARLDESRPIEQSPVDLVTVTSDAVEAARAVGPEWHVAVEAGGPVMVSGDRSRLRQVFDNLLSNLRAHTPPGTTATIEISQVGTEAVCRFTDNGPGISEADAARIFERFFRVVDHSPEPGSGLGLYLCSNLARRQGGTVSLDWSELGQGSTFSLRLPKAD